MLAGAGAVLGAVATAHAADEYHMVLLDRTGSMSTTDAADIGGATISRWQRGTTLAKGWVDQTAGVNPLSVARAYSIWTFSTYEPNGLMAKQWPKVATDCTGAGLTAVNDPQGTLAWCELPKNKASYSKVGAKLTELATSLMPDGDTPLSDALCGAIGTVYNGTANKQRTIILESDGEENSSLAECSGNPSDSNYTAWDKSKPDWNMTDSTLNYMDTGLIKGAWEALVVRKLTRFEARADMWKPGALALADAVPPAINWLVDFHYRWCVPDPNNACSAAATAFLPLALGPVMLDAAPAPVPLPQVAKDFNFFRAMGTSNPKSKFRPVVTITGSQYGLNHAVPGDVDDGGCTDQADLNIMMQGDVWHKAAVPPRQIAMRADLDRNGFVNEADRSILLSFWATGCINPVAPPRY
jgi:hypothetical protein